jgi:hypothetical protein
MKFEPVKLPGRKSGYACKIWHRGRHVATVADPDRESREGALAAAYAWERDWASKLVRNN